MKNIFKVSALALCLMVTACSDFLDLKPRDMKVVSTVEDYRDILATYMRLVKTVDPLQEPLVFGEAYCSPKFVCAGLCGIYTGETTVQTTSGAAYYNSNSGTYTPDGKALLNWMRPDEEIWNRYYRFLGPINLIIESIPTAEGTDEDLRNYVKGEALAWRAYSFFKLLQFYSPYKQNEYGIPLTLTAIKDIGIAKPVRAAQSECFAQILKDCNEVLALLEKTGTHPWNCIYRKDFVQAMMAAVYHWKAMSGAAEATDWAQAEKYASAAMNMRSLTNESAVLKALFDCSRVNRMKPFEHDECYIRLKEGSWRQLLNETFRMAYYAENTEKRVDGIPKPEHLAMFKATDIRRQAWFTADGRSDKYSLLQDSYGAILIPFRLAEMYLIKAEALARQGKAGEAVAVMTEFCKARYTDDQTIPTDADKLLQLILDQRFCEFYHENDMRWFEMKRLGVKVERIVEGERYVLLPNDFRYTFPIPRRELELNVKMKQTPGWENVNY